MEDAEFLFYQEVRDKKRTATGAFHMTGHGVKNGIRGGMKTPVDYLRGKEKKNYTKGGVIMEYNIYDTLENIPKLKELQNLDFDVAKNILTRAKERFTTKELFQQLGTSNGTLYKLYDIYGIEYGKRPKLSNDKPKEVKVIDDVYNPKNYGKEFDKYKDIKNVPSVEEFEKMDYEEARKIILFVRMTYTLTELRKQWNCGGTFLYNTFFKKYNIPNVDHNKNRIVLDKPIDKTEVVQVNPASHYEQENMIDKYTEKFNTYSTTLTEYAKELESKIAALKAENERLIEYQGFKINLAGTFDQAELDKRISAIQLQLINGKEYSVKIVIEECM